MFVLGGSGLARWLCPCSLPCRLLHQQLPALIVATPLLHAASPRHAGTSAGVGFAIPVDVVKSSVDQVGGRVGGLQGGWLNQCSFRCYHPLEITILRVPCTGWRTAFWQGLPRVSLSAVPTLR